MTKPLHHRAVEIAEFIDAGLTSKSAIAALITKIIDDETKELRTKLAEREWQPIETAPKIKKSEGNHTMLGREYIELEGPAILLLIDGEIYKGAWNHEREMWKDVYFGQYKGMGGLWYPETPTHWMLPKPPTNKGSE